MTRLLDGLRRTVGDDVAALLGFLLAVVVVFGIAAPKFLSAANFDSIAFQLPEFGLLTLAMLIPIISGGINLAIIYTANMAGLTLAWVLNSHGGPDAGVTAFVVGSVLAIGVGALAGAVMGAVIAYTGAHPILVSLAMMIFLRGLGEFLTRGGDISGFPDFMAPIGHGTLLGIPVPLVIFAVAAVAWHFLLSRTRHGVAASMIGSNIRATEYSGIPVKRTLTLIYTLSGAMCALAGILMLARFNSVRVGHGEALLLVTVLACFLGGVDPFGGFGRVAPVAVALVVLQALSSGLNLIGANQHLSTAVWGLFLIAVMILRWTFRRLQKNPKGRT
ncbi:ABC transporter permease [Oharaeibacter diazotrophicus]|uniref:Monosaccharide ABC transporter membrane protein (CUT2 family) n=1 Tax=Oharaeibacter diazotrophicus TaxID=1920512 RepID=A0A4R6RMK2_9HYPH|nr:ABC transporter permease [Oharaeibacter diazotrophicus]TDP87804.1 monosaccharide ABC transporter membrane protein (CUT2 family) [Oharaeibacter diazotrophicus]BBE74614.1 autoinducer 2 import system permease protein LsrD [Pleomorphomonas sp. SM30]GLS76989.1 ABC transporter permease [Oharaeibacter diazotrophicus]